MIGTLLELFWSCTKIGRLAFGGGNAAIPLLESEAVPRWISEQEFGELVGINFAFPGISILKLAGMVGLRAAGIPRLLMAVIGIAAGVDCVVVCNAFTVSQDFSGAWRMLHAIRELPGVLAGSLLFADDSGDAPLHHRGSLL